MSDPRNPTGRPARLSGMALMQAFPRRRLLLIGLVVALLVAVSVPWLLRDRDSSSTPHAGPTAPIAGGLHVVARIGAAEQLMAAHVPVGLPTKPSDVRAAAEADIALGIDLLQRVQNHSSGNLSVSPMSLAIALTMLQNGAGGKTLAGIRSALHSGDASLDAGWSALVDDWTNAAASNGFSLQSANSLWLSPGLPTRTKFMTALAQYFHAGVWRVDFTKPGAKDAINTWTSQQTHGRIAKLFDALDPATQAVLANAVYFKATWDEPFDPSDTQPGRFTNGDGTSTSASFMSQTASLQSATSSGYTAVQLPYRGGRFAALAIMPTSGSLADYVRGLSAAELKTVVAGLQTSSVQLSMPKFTTSSTLELNEPLKAMGMGDAFTDAADFSALSPVGLEVDKVVQRVDLKVGEKGTEAAAATGIVMRTTGAVAERSVITLDHPFVFLIRDTKTGAILFASEIQHPGK